MLRSQSSAQHCPRGDANIINYLRDYWLEKSTPCLDNDAARAKTHPNLKLASVELKPGMTATVDVRTGHRSVLKYLAKPVYKAFGGAMNER